MFTSKRLLVVASLASVLLLGVVAAHADMIPVTNAGFEDPVGTLNAETKNLLPTGWTRSNTADIYVANGTAVAGGAGLAGPAPEGAQVMELHYGTQLWQNTGVELVPGYTYTLNFQTSFQASGTKYCSAAGYLYAADNTSSQGTSFSGEVWNSGGVPGTAWNARSVSAAYAGATGKYLSVSVGSGQSGGDWTGFDAVSVTSTAPIPEPSVVGLLTTGLIALLCYAWRKQK